MQDKNGVPRKIAQDIVTVQKICDLIGGLAIEDKELVCWITAEDIEETKRKISHGNQSHT